MHTPPPRGPEPRRLTRSSREKMWAGVAGGLAEYFDVDPVIIRLIWVAGAVLTGGLAIPAYIVLWFVMPQDDVVGRGEPPRRPNDWSDGGVGEQFRTGAQRLTEDARRMGDELRGAGPGSGRPFGPVTPPSAVSDDGGKTWRPASPSDPVVASVSAPAGETVVVSAGSGSDDLDLGRGAAASKGTWTVPESEPVTEPAAAWYPPADPERGQNRQRTAGMVLVAMGVLFLLSEAGVFRWLNWSVIWPLVLVGIGVALLARQSGWRR